MPKNSLHVSDVKLASQSDTMSVGSPWYFHTSLAKILARTAAVFSRSGIKCAILVNRSMITHSWSHPSHMGSSMMKSIAIDCQDA